MLAERRRPASPVYQISLKHARGCEKAHSGDEQNMPAPWPNAVKPSDDLENALQKSNRASAANSDGGVEDGDYDLNDTNLPVNTSTTHKASDTSIFFRSSDEILNGSYLFVKCGIIV